MKRSISDTITIEAYKQWWKEAYDTFPGFVDRTFSLRDAVYAPIVSQADLEARAGVLMGLLSRGDDVTTETAKETRARHRAFTRTLEMAEWSSRNGARHPTSEGAPWHDAPKTNPADPKAAIAAATAEFMDWAERAKIAHAEKLARAVSLVKTHGPATYGEYLRESGLDFTTWLTNRALPVYDRVWIANQPHVDSFFFENVYKGGVEMQLLAMFAHQGVSKVIDALENLAPRAVTTASAPVLK